MKQRSVTSLGSLGDSVKALKIDGTEATAENVKNGTYKVARPFNVVYKESSLNDLAQDFVNFIMSEEGQAVIEEGGYVSRRKQGCFRKQETFRYDHSSRLFFCGSDHGKTEGSVC